MMPRDPMTSAEQAEVEADEKFYEDRDDAEPADDAEWDDPSWDEGRVDNN